MLTFEPPIYEIHGVIVFRDHASPTQFYYLAGRPRLTRDKDGKPTLLLLKYRHALDAMGNASARLREQLGGAFLTFGVDCTIDDLDAIKSALQALVPPDAGPVALAPVLYTKGTVSIIALDAQHAAAPSPDSGAAAAEQSRFVRGILGSAVPSLLGHQEAIFSLSLSPDAASLLENAYQSEMSPIGVMYELEFAGLRPAIAVRATADYKRCYEAFKAGLTLGVRSGGGTASGGGSTGTGSTSGSGSGSSSGSGPSGSGSGAGSGTATPGVAAAGGAGIPTGSPGTVIPDGTQLTSATGNLRFKLAGAVTLNGRAATAEGPAVANSNPAAIVAAAAGANGNLPVGSVLTWVNPPSGVAPTLTLTTALSGGTDPVQAATGTTTQPTGSNSGTPSTTSGGGAQVAIDADLSYTMEKLKQTGAIKIEIIRQQEGQSVDSMEKAAMELLKEQLLKDFFSPAMSNAPAQPGIGSAVAAAGAVSSLASATTAGTSQGQTGSSGTRVELGFQLQYKTEEQLKEISFDYSVVAPETRKHCPNGFFSALVGRSEKKEHIRTIDLDDPFFKIIDVQANTTADFEALDLKTIVLDLQYGGTPAAPHQTGSAQFSPDSSAPRSFQTYREGDDLSYRYRIGYKFGQAERIAAQRHEYQTGWNTTTSRALVVHPPEHIAMLRVYLEQGVVDWELVKRIETRLRYEDAANNFRTERTFFIAPESQRQEWSIRLTDPAVRSYFVQHTWHLKDGSSITGPEEREATSQLFVGDPFVDRLTVLIHPQVDPASVLRTVIELRYDDPENNLAVHKSVELVGPNYRSSSVTLPIMNRERREYTYQVSLIKVNGAAENHAPVQTDQLSIVVTEGGVYFDVSLVLLGDLAQRNIDAIQVDLRAEPLTGEVTRIESHLFERGGERRIQKRLLIRADRPRRFEYRTTVFQSDGGMLESAWQAHENAILPLQLAQLLPR